MQEDTVNEADGREQQRQILFTSHFTSECRTS